MGNIGSFSKSSGEDTSSEKFPPPIYRSPSQESIDRLQDKVKKLQQDTISEKLTQEVIDTLRNDMNEIKKKKQEQSNKKQKESCIAYIDRNRQNIREMIMKSVVENRRLFISPANIRCENGNFVLLAKNENMHILKDVLKEDDEFSKFDSKIEWFGNVGYLKLC